MGGHDLPNKFTFKTFRDWSRHELEGELRRQRKAEANGVGVPSSQATAAATSIGRSQTLLQADWASYLVMAAYYTTVPTSVVGIRKWSVETNHVSFFFESGLLYRDSQLPADNHNRG